MFGIKSDESVGKGYRIWQAGVGRMRNVKQHIQHFVAFMTRHMALEEDGDDQNSPAWGSQLASVQKSMPWV